MQKGFPIKYILCSLFILQSAFLISAQPLPQKFMLEDVKSYPFPSELSVSSNTERWAVSINKNGFRNIFASEGMQGKLRQVSSYNEDTGQEISSLSISADGNWIIYIRGGDFGSNWNDSNIVNPAGLAEPEKTKIYAIPFSGEEEARAIDEGLNPKISPDSKKILYTKEGQLWEMAIDGTGKPSKLFHARGSQSDASYSPEGDKILFRSNRGDHSFIGIFHKKGKKLEWIIPSFYRDDEPSWSIDGKSIAFIRQSIWGGEPDSLLLPQSEPWTLMRYDLTEDRAMALWTSPSKPEGNRPWTHGGVNLNYGNGYISFTSYHSGFPHLYSIPENGGSLKALTSGNYMVEYVSMDAEGNHLYYSANTGPEYEDIDRRHLGKVSIAEGKPAILTPGDGNEWIPRPTKNHLVYISAGYQSPPMPTVMELKSGKSQRVGLELIPKNFPENDLVKPEQVIFKSSDGLDIHGTLFKSKGNKKSKKPAIVYIHGGPPRQMLLGWHYSNYYSNAYALNQYLASRGFVVLSVNYRLGIGYGYDFQYPKEAGWRGASEYADIRSAGIWLAQQSFVDPAKIGVYGGSYGGFLTAMALGRDSELFAAGVDIHGVHDWTKDRIEAFTNPNQYERIPDADLAVERMWESSPVAYIDDWESPVLIIHGDDDRNVDFKQSTDLVRRLLDNGVPFETLVIPDDTHHFMMHQNQMRVNQAIAEFLLRKLME